MLRLLGGVNKADGAVATSYEKARVIRAARASHYGDECASSRRMTVVTMRIAPGNCQLCAAARAVITRRRRAPVALCGSRGRLLCSQVKEFRPGGGGQPFPALRFLLGRSGAVIVCGVGAVTKFFSVSCCCFDQLVHCALFERWPRRSARFSAIINHHCAGGD